MKYLKPNWYLNMVILAVLVRLLIMPFFFHPDIKTYYFQSSFLSQGVWNIYQYLPDHKDSLPLKEEFVYFPLTYFTLGVYQIIAAPLLGPDFQNWLSNASASSVDAIGVYRYLFIMKLPYLVLDLLTAIFLVKLVSDEKDKKRILLLWLFNPFSIVILYVFSNVDIWPVFLSVLALYFAKGQKYWLAALMLGLGAGFKAYPLLFVPLIFLLAPSWKDKILTILMSFVPFLLIIAPFLRSPGFQEATLNSGLTTRIIANGLSIGFGQMLYPAIIMLAIIYYLSWQNKINIGNLPAFCLAVILAIFMSIHFHIQWLLWPMPFAILILTNKRGFLGIFLALIITALLIPFFYDDASMTVSTFSVINPLFENLPTPFKIMQHFEDPVIIQSLLQSILFGLGLVSFWQLFKKETL